LLFAVVAGFSAVADCVFVGRVLSDGAVAGDGDFTAAVPVGLAGAGCWSFAALAWPVSLDGPFT
jgi:hypothetical protein